MSESADAGATDPSVAVDRSDGPDLETTSRQPWWRRATTWIVTALIVVAGAAVIWALSSNGSSQTDDTVAGVTFTEIERTTLEEITTLAGTLGFVPEDPIVYAGSTTGITTISAGNVGTITSLPADGSTVEEGGVLYTWDEQPVVVFYGEVPAYRTLDTHSSDGADVLQLEEALTRLGYNEEADLTVDTDFTYVTRDAIKALQEDLGIEETGTLLPGTYAFVDGPVFVAETLVDVGSPINAGSPVVATSTMPSGTVTAAASEGDVLDHGDALLALEGDPVVLFVASVPFYRTLTVGSFGDDVRVLEETLASFGFDAAGNLVVDEEFDEATVDVVVAWQESIGAPVDGVVNIGEIIATEAPIRIATMHIGIGSDVTPGTALVTPSSSTSVVSVQLPAEDQELLGVDDAVNVVMPNGSDEPGTVTSVGTVAIQSQDGGAYFEVEVILDREDAGAGLDEAPVDVEVIDDRAADVLAVPVTALLALSEGGYAVEVDTGDGTTTLVAVEAGMYADGMVEITSSRIEAGMRVVTP